MKRSMIAIAILMGVALAVSSMLVADQQVPSPNVPGKPSLAQIFVVNGRDEAIPVVLQPGGDVQPVTMVGTPSVSIGADSTVGARAVRQAWEYRAIAVTSGQDPSSALNVAGIEGWEAVGVIAGANGSTQVLLKRPR